MPPCPSPTPGALKLMSIESVMPSNHLILCCLLLLLPSIFPSIRAFSSDAHLGCYHILAIINDASVNMGVQISFQVSVFVSFGYVPRGGIAGSYGSFTLTFQGSSILFSIMAVPICNPNKCVQGFSLAHILTSVCCLLSFFGGHSDRHGMASRCDVVLDFYNDEWCWASSHVLFGQSFYLLWENIYSGLWLAC